MTRGLGSRNTLQEAKQKDGSSMFEGCWAMSLKPSPYVCENISLICPQTWMSKLGHCRFHIPLLPRDSDPKDRDTGLLGAPALRGTPPKRGKELLMPIFLSAMQTLHGQPLSLSATT